MERCGGAESDGSQITEDLVRPDLGNNKNGSRYLLSIYYVAGTTLSTLEHFLFNLHQNIITNEGTEGYRRKITARGNKTSKWEVGLTPSMA